MHLLVGNDVRGVHQQQIEGDASFVVDIGARHGRAVYLAFQHRSHCVLPTAVRARKNPFGCRKGSTQSPTATSVCSVSVAVRSKRVWLYGLVAHRPAVGGIDCNASVAEGGPQSTARSTARAPLGG